MTSKQATTLSEYLDHVSVFRRKWTDEETADVKGEVTQLWFRGQHDSRWGLQPKFYRPQFREAVEPEIRQEFQSRAMQMAHLCSPVLNGHEENPRRHDEFPFWPNRLLPAISSSVVEINPGKEKETAQAE